VRHGAKFHGESEIRQTVTAISRFFNFQDGGRRYLARSFKIPKF